MGNSLGRHLKVMIFGESHGEAIGCVIDGLPAGISIDLDEVKMEMARRRPGQNEFSTPRKEADAFEILSGYFNGFTTGSSLAMIIRNSNQHSRDYEKLRYVMRPGHADYSGYVKYNGFNDYRGGGHFSGRITAPLVFAGAIAKQVLRAHGIRVYAHVKAIHGIMDRPFNPMGEEETLLKNLHKESIPVLDKEAGEKMKAEILSAKYGRDSVGGIIECMALGVPAGLGDPFFDSLESEISHIMFSVPAVKGIEFGDGFGISGLKGSEANDPMKVENGHVVTETNHNGGILGGITNGMPVLFRVAVKPTASISREQDTVDVNTMENTKLVVGGRHDPCIVGRAVPVVEAAAAFVILDAYYENLIMKEEEGK